MGIKSEMNKNVFGLEYMNAVTFSGSLHPLLLSFFFFLFKFNLQEKKKKDDTKFAWCNVYELSVNVHCGSPSNSSCQNSSSNFPFRKQWYIAMGSGSCMRSEE